MYLSLSSEVAPIIREYERFTATAINAYVGPRVTAYLVELNNALKQRGFSNFIGIMKSDGTPIYEIKDMRVGLFTTSN